MAESPGYGLGFYTPTPPPPSTPRDWLGFGSDTLQDVRSGVDTAGAALAAGANYIQNQTGNGDPQSTAALAQQFFNLDDIDAQSDISDQTRQQLQESVTSPEFWNHPFTSAYFQAVNMAPMIGAMVGSAALGPEGPVATALAAGAGGALNAGAGINEIDQAMQKYSDAQLMSNPYYRHLRRDQGMSEQQARTDLNLKIQGTMPLWNALVGAGAAAAGPAGKFAGLPLGTAGAGLLRRVGEGALEAGVGMGAQSGVSEYGQESALGQIDPTQGFDPNKVAGAVLSGAISGAAMGGAFGVLPHGHEAVDAKSPDAAQSAALSTEGDTTGVPITPPAPAGAGVEAVAPDETMAQTAAQGVTGATVPGAPEPEVQAPPPNVGPSTTAGGAQTASLPQESAAEAAARTQPSAAGEALQRDFPKVGPASAARAAGPAAGVTPEVAQTADAIRRVAGVAPDTGAVTDAGKTVPEPPSALQAQRQQLVDGKRAAMFYPKGTLGASAVPEGMRKASVQGGTIHFNPEMISHADVMKAAKPGPDRADRLNEILGLGPYNKADVAKKIMQGEPAVGVVGRDAAGNEVQSAIGTPSTAPEQAAAIARDPNLKVGIERPEETLAARAQATAAEKPVTQEAKGPRVIRTVSPDVQKILDAHNASVEAVRKEMAAAAKKAADEHAKVAGTEAAVAELRKAGVSEEDIQKVASKGKGSKLSKADIQKRADENAAAKKITDAHPPKENEAREFYRRTPAGEKARAEILARAKAMVSDAEKVGLKIPKSARMMADATNEQNSSLVLLQVAEDLTKKKGTRLADFEQFLKHEAMLRNGGREDKRMVINERSEQAAAKKRKGTKGESSGGTEEVEKLAGKIPEPSTEDIESPEGGEGEGDEEEIGLGGEAGTQAGAEAQAPGEEGKGLGPAGEEGRGAAEGEGGAPAKEEAEGGAGGAEPGGGPGTGERAGTGPRPGGRGEPGEGARRGEAAGGGQRETGAERERVLREGRERPAVADVEKRVVAGEDKAGTFKVEKKRRITQVGNTLKMEESGRDRPLNISKADLDATDKVRTTTVADEIGKRVEGTHPAEGFSRYIAQRVSKIAGDVKVHVISDADMSRLTGGRDVGGFYSRTDDAIYIPEKYANGDPKVYSHIIQHEALHAALMHLIETDADVKPIIRKMMDDAAIELMDKHGFTPEQLKNLYGLTNEHEFISEAMSNVDMQRALTKFPASPEVSKAVGLYGQISSIARALVTMIRNKLGIPRTETATRQIENAFKLTDMLLDKTEKLGRGFVRDQHLALAAARDHAPAQLAIRMEDDPLAAAFRPTLADGLTRGKEGATKIINAATEPAAYAAKAMSTARAFGRAADRVLKYITTSDQLATNPVSKRLVPMMRDIFDNIEKTAVLAKQLREPGDHLAGLMLRAAKKYPGAFEEFASLINDQTMHGVNAAEALGKGYNKHLQTSMAVAAKLAKGVPLTDIEHDMALNSWQARHEYPQLKARYDALVKKVPEFAELQKRTFDFYRDAQEAMSREKIDNILRGYGYDGADRKAIAERVYNGKFDDDFRKELEDKVGAGAARALENAESLQVKNGPYAPLMRLGTHAIVGEYKLTQPGKAINKVDDSTYEFKNREDALDFVKSNGLNNKVRTVYYDQNGNRVTKEHVTATSDPEQRIQVKVDRQHLEFHDHAESRDAQYEALKKTGLFDKLAKVTRKDNVTENREFTDRGTQALLKSMEQAPQYQNATPTEKEALRSIIVDAGLRHQSDNRVQSRRLPRRGVKGAGVDPAQNLLIYNTSMSNYRARDRYRAELAGLMQDMHDHEQQTRYDGNSELRSNLVKEVERRVNSTNPDDYTGKYTDLTRRVMMWSYVDRMLRASHLILHQTHLPMITAPFMAGRHGMMQTTGMLMKNWRLLSGAYKAGGKDFMNSVADALHAGTDYGHLFDQLVSGEKDGARLSKMFSTLEETGLLHPAAGIEVGKYLPAKQLTGVLGNTVGVLDRVVQHGDTMFRHLTNATEAINRYVGATTAYRLEFEKLTRAGKSADEAHAGAVEYARKVISETQGLYSPTNAAPMFKNPILRPFLQFKQFPQMMYSMLSRLAVQSLKGETREVRVEAMKSLALVLGSHMVMAGVLQGLPLEPFKMLAWTAKQLHLSDKDWSDVEDAVRQHIVDNFGQGVASDVLLHGVGGAIGGVDVHHRMGLNSFYTYGLPEKTDSGSIAQFILNSVAGAPEGLAADTLGGIRKMADGDIVGGALQASPFQTLRDIHQAMQVGPKRSGYEPTTADRFKRIIGFTPEADAEANEREQAVYNAVSSFTQKRNDLIKQYVAADPADRADLWDEIQQWNQDKPESGRINKGQLIRAQASAKKAAIPDVGNIAGVRVNKQTRDYAKSVASYY